MTILVDHNCSFKLCSVFRGMGYESWHVTDMGKDRSLDEEIWEFAKGRNWIIFTKDKDFCQFSQEFGHPPKVIFLAVGNKSTTEIKSIILDKKDEMQQFVIDDNFAILKVKTP